MRTLLPIFICGLFLAFLSDRASVYELDAYGERIYIRRDWVLFFAMALAMAVFVGLRTRGNDTGTYHHMYDGLVAGWDTIRDIEWAKLAAAPGFVFVNTLLKMAGCSFQTYLMVYALFTVITYLWFIRKYSCNILFSVFLFFTMGVYGFTMAAIKQTVAVAILLIATDRAIQKKYISFIVLVLIAELFHPYAFIYLLIPLLDFCPWSSKTYFLLAASAAIAFGLQYLIEPLLAVTDALGADYSENTFTGDGVNVFRVLVVWMPVLLSFIAQKQIRGDGNRTSNIVMNLSMVNAMIMFIGLFGTANNFARLANYFLIFQTLSLPWVMKYYTMGSRRFLTVGAVAGYLGYYYYGAAIANGSFDSIYSFISFGEFLRQLIRG